MPQTPEENQSLQASGAEYDRTGASLSYTPKPFTPKKSFVEEEWNCQKENSDEAVKHELRQHQCDEIGKKIREIIPQLDDLLRDRGWEFRRTLSQICQDSTAYNYLEESDLDGIGRETAVHKVIDELMSLVGLEQVKNFFLREKANIETCAEFRHNCKGTVDTQRLRFNAVFQGNPGTGKTTVARLYAKFLHLLGVLKSSEVIETSGAKLAHSGPGGILRDVKDLLDKSDGGLIFIDEAHQLMSSHSGNGEKRALDVILTEMENNVGKLVVVFAGYSKEMETFFLHNPGLPNRVPHTLHFEDFDEWQLAKILYDRIKWRLGDGIKIADNTTSISFGLYIRIAVRRLFRQRGSRGFGNGHAVENLAAVIAQRQATRLSKERIQMQQKSTSDGKSKSELDYMVLTKEDVIGPDPRVEFQKCEPWEKLQEMIGLSQVKRTAFNMIHLIQTNYLRELEERQPMDVPLNRIFYGSPGTGKKTVASLYGKILAQLGLLSKGDVIIKKPADFIGRALGHSEERTKAILDATVGQVLIIDEAYGLDPGDSDGNVDTYKAAVLDTIVAEVQGLPNEDRCILLLGYEDRLQAMFRNANPGLGRRFAIDDPFRFEDVDVPQLIKILRSKLAQQDLWATSDAIQVARDMFERARMRPDFSNAGEVDMCLNRAKNNYRIRQLNNPPKMDFDRPLEPVDFDPDFHRGDMAQSCRTYLRNKVSESIILQLEELQQIALNARRIGHNPGGVLPMGFIFKGPPGTGKSVTALNMAKIYYDMGLLSTKEVIECSASDLIGEYVGQTGTTKRQLEKALGKVLFIDDASRLKEGQYAAEAVEEMAYLLSTPRYKGRMIVILAGHTKDMEDLLAAKPNLACFFEEDIVFEIIQPNDCILLLKQKLKEKHISASCFEAGDLYTKAFMLFDALRSDAYPSWGNGNARDIKSLASLIARDVYKSCSKSVIPTSNAPEAIELHPEKALDCMRKILSIHSQRSTQIMNEKFARKKINGATSDIMNIPPAEEFAEQRFGFGGSNDRKSDEDPTTRAPFDLGLQPYTYVAAHGRGTIVPPPVPPVAFLIPDASTTIASCEYGTS